jgi:hypothetical protein
MAEQEEGMMQFIPTAPNQNAYNTAHRNAAIGIKDTIVESVRINMGSGNEEKNNIIQFDIVNSQAGSISETVRIGSHLGMADAYIRYGTSPSAADSVNGISDNFGINVQQCQGFSEMSTTTPKFVRQIKLISGSVGQLNKQFSHKTILPDFTIIPLVNNIAFTRDKQDQATDLNVAKGSWLLSPKNWLEFTMVSGADLSILMELSSIADVRSFIKA